MPTTNDQFERPDNHPFELIPWLDTTEYHYGIDSLERGGGIKFPPTGPGADIISRFNLSPDEDRRMWFHEATLLLFQSRIWDNMTSEGPDSDTGTRGEQFEIRLDFLMRILAEFEAILVLQVGLRRDTHSPYYQRQRGDDDDDELAGWIEDREGVSH